MYSMCKELLLFFLLDGYTTYHFYVSLSLKKKNWDMV